MGEEGGERRTPKLSPRRPGMPSAKSRICWSWSSVSHSLPWPVLTCTRNSKSATAAKHARSETTNQVDPRGDGRIYEPLVVLAEVRVGDGPAAVAIVRLDDLDRLEARTVLPFHAEATRRARSGVGDGLGARLGRGAGVVDIDAEVLAGADKSGPSQRGCALRKSEWRTNE